VRPPTIDWRRAIPLFLTQAKSLISDPVTWHVTFPDLVFGLAYFGGGHLFLGAAISGWASQRLVQPCIWCTLPSYVVSATGSPLSGAGAWSGACPCCGSIRVNESITGLVKQIGVYGQWSSLGYRPILQYGSPWKFSFRDGAVRQGNHEEIRLPVPGWREFMTGFDSSLITNENPFQDDHSIDFGFSLHGKVVSFGSLGVKP